MFLLFDHSESVERKKSHKSFRLNLFSQSAILAFRNIHEIKGYLKIALEIIAFLSL